MLFIIQALIYGAISPNLSFFPEIRVKFSVFEIHEHLLPVEKENNNFKIFLMGAFRDI